MAHYSIQSYNILYIIIYILSEAWSVVNWAEPMAAQGAFGTDFYDRSILRPKHRAYTPGQPCLTVTSE